jgi:hypothetical protein
VVHHIKTIIDIIDVSNDPVFTIFRTGETCSSIDIMVKQILLLQSFLA